MMCACEHYGTRPNYSGRPLPEADPDERAPHSVTYCHVVCLMILQSPLMCTRVVHKSNCRVSALCSSTAMGHADQVHDLPNVPRAHAGNRPKLAAFSLSLHSVASAMG